MKGQDAERLGLQQCWDSAGSWCTTISAAIQISEQPGQSGLQECWDIAGSWCTSISADNEIGDAGAESFAGVLEQCAALTHLDLKYTWIRASRGRKACSSADAVHSADSSQSLQKSDRSCRESVALSFVAWSSLLPCFVGTLHCLLFAILGDRQATRMIGRHPRSMCVRILD
jgi:hypothetical protein